MLEVARREGWLRVWFECPPFPELSLFLRIAHGCGAPVGRAACVDTRGVLQSMGLMAYGIQCPGLAPAGGSANYTMYTRAKRDLGHSIHVCSVF